MDKKKIIEEMTLEEKAVFLTGKDFWQTKDYERFGIKPMFLADGPHGIRRQAAASDHLGLNASIPATCFPTAATVANSWNESLGQKIGEALGEEAKAQRVNVLLGPGLNIKRNPRCGRNFEYFSEDPYLAGKMAAAYVRGIQKNGTSACIKHFAANNQELRRMTSDSVMDERTLREIYLTGFEIAVKEGKPKSVMSSYNMVNGVYANENEHLLRDILRGEWGYNGVVVSDWAGSNDRVAAVKAGSDLEMPSCKYGIGDVIKAVNDGTLTISYLDECVKRLLDLYESTLIEESVPTDFDISAHNDLARECAEESIVLLKNNGALPLKKGVKIAFVGDFAENPRYQGAGSSIVNPTVLSRFVGNLTKSKVKNAPVNKNYEQGIGSAAGKVPIGVVETFVEDVNDYGINVIGYEKGFDRYGKESGKLIKKAVGLAERADVTVLFVGLDEVSEAEGLDRENIRLNDNQIKLYDALKATGKQIVVVLFCGSAVELGWARDCSALLYACLSGQAAADAVMNVLVGKVNPSGKLAETFPVKYEDCATSRYFPGIERTSEYRESIYVGYRYYDKQNFPVEYPFGYGLSYTDFEYADLKADETGVSFTLKNVGKCDGAEVSQIYVGKCDGKVFRAEKELKGFKKTFLNSGESKTVRVPFDDKTFRYFNVKTNGWETEGGTYQIYVGASSKDLRLSAEVVVKGTTDETPYDASLLPSYYKGNVTKIGDAEFKALLGREIPNPHYNFYKKNRMFIDENCAVADLKYSKGWTGRAFSRIIRASIKLCKFFGKKAAANTLIMGVLYQPVRGLAKFGGMTRRKMEGLILMFNGSFFKGAFRFLSKEQKKKD